MKKSLLLFLIIYSFSNQNSYSQIAYDGLNDHIFAGYINVGNKSGFEIQYESSLNEYLSCSLFINYLINPSKNHSYEQSDFDDKEFKSFNNFVNSFNSGMILRLHIGTFFNALNERIDPFAGVDISLKSIGGNLGLKYQLTQSIGFYTNYNYSFSNSIQGIEIFNDSDSNVAKNYFGKRNSFSIGITITL